MVKKENYIAQNGKKIIKTIYKQFDQEIFWILLGNLEIEVLQVGFARGSEF